MVNNQRVPTVCAKRLLYLLLPCFLLSCTKIGYEVPSPEFQLQPEVLNYVARPGEIVESQNVQLLEAHGLDHPWHVEAGQPWVLVSPERGEGPGQVVVGVRTDGLAPGLHRSELAFVSNLSDGDEGRAELVVELEILESGWQPLGGVYAAQVRSAAWDPGDPDRILVGTEENHLFVSNDRGASFHRTDFEAVGTHYGPYISDIQIRNAGRAYLSVYQAESSLGGVYRSDDAGRTWSPTGLQNHKIRSLMLFDDDYLWARGDVIWSSVDAGENWSEVVLPGPIHFIAPHPNIPSQAILGGDTGLLYVTDGSAVLASIDTGMDGAVHGFTALDNGIWIARRECENGNIPILHRSSDGGQSWQVCATAGIPQRTFSNPYPMFSSGTDLFVANGNLYRSRDAGESFSYIEEGFAKLCDHGWIQGGKAHPEGLMLFHDQAGLLWLEPGGNRLEALPLMDHSIVDLRWHASSRQLFGVTSPGGAFRVDSTGAFFGLGGGGLTGESWYSISVDPRNHLILLAGEHSSGLFRSVDGGLNWIQDPVGAEALDYPSDLERPADDPDIIWAAGASYGLWVSDDGGESFLEIVEEGTITRVAPLNGRKALINLDGIQRIDLDTGLLEVLVETTAPTLLTRTADGAIYYGHEYYNIHRSTDEGANFVELPFGSGRRPRAVAVDPNDPQRIWLGYDTGLFESRDNGQTFDEVFAPFPVTSLSYDADGDRLFVGTTGGGVYRYLPEP